jgi:hypothetical protein
MTVDLQQHFVNDSSFATTRTTNQRLDATVDLISNEHHNSILLILAQLRIEETISSFQTFQLAHTDLKII